LANGLERCRRRDPLTGYAAALTAANLTQEKLVTLPAPVQDLCDRFPLLAERELPADLLTGLYLHGGVVFGEWAPRESDVDFVATLAHRP
jgi:hypothetical protein